LLLLQVRRLNLPRNESHILTIKLTRHTRRRSSSSPNPTIRIINTNRSTDIVGQEIRLRGPTEL
jgi:hypothetical protein